MTQTNMVIIVGAGSSGLAMASCLTINSIPYIILDREDCSASLWKKHTYDRLHLHTAKSFCELPNFPFPSSYPTFVPKNMFINYLDDYVSHFDINPLYRRSVEFAGFDEEKSSWVVKAKNLVSGEIEVYEGRFLVVASGENSIPYVPKIEGLSSFNGDRVVHSTRFKNGKEFRDKKVLVVGSGNSGMEIAFDLATHGAKTSIVVRSPVHILSRNIVYIGMNLMKYLPFGLCDGMLNIMGKLFYGDMEKYGIKKPKEGPFYMKNTYGKYPIFDVGTCNKIRTGEIQVLPGITRIEGNEILFENGKTYHFDNIIFCTGFKRSTNTWLQEDEYLLNEDGLSTHNYPNHLEGKNGLYCLGLSRQGFHGATLDAQKISQIIRSIM